MGGPTSRNLSRFATLVGIGLATVLIPTLASAAEPTDELRAVEGQPTRARASRGRFFALEANAMVTREMIPTSFMGVDAALAFGNETFALRAGGAVLGAPSFQLGHNEISNLLAYGMLDACASKNVREHRVRMCLGGELGGWKHYWRGYGRPDRVESTHVAGTLKGDYRYRFTRNFGLLLGVGLSIPAVGPQFRGRDPLGRPSPVLVPGPVTGTFRFGGSFGFG